ncbi:MAG TPA: HEPN domain-containing protein [Desulfobacterales bacterium]|nr:HEPN domain-containing protein [Desulfobacterales bacterium]
MCFHAQQGMEKYLKAWLIEHGVDFPKTHDLEALAKLCLPSLPELQSLIDGLRFLTSFAVEIRYPGIFASKADADCCLHTALRGRDILRRQFRLEEGKRTISP